MSSARSTLFAGVLAVALFAGTLWLFYPGLVSYDSILQFHEAQSGRFTTTHPPLMAATWRALRTLAPGAVPMLLLDLLLYWGSFFVLTLYCIRRGTHRWGRIAVLAGMWPLLLAFAGVIWKDVLLAASWGLAGGLLLLAATERARRHSLLHCLGAAALLLFGTAMRHNGAPAAILLVLGLCSVLPAGRPVRVTAFVSLAVAILVAVPVSNRIVAATDTKPFDSLISWDLTGISYFSGRDYRAPVPNVRVRPSCYSPRLFDACPVVPFPTEQVARSRWISAIAAEPIAYLKHRMLVFSMLLRFGCTQCRPYIWESGARSGGAELAYRDNPVRSVLGMIVRAIGHTPVGRPYLWLAASLGLAVVQWKRSTEPDSRVLALIALSGAIYAFTYLPAAVTDEFRYLYWLIYAVVLVVTAAFFTGKLARGEALRWIVVPMLILFAADSAVQLLAPTDAIAPSMVTNY